MPECAYRLGQHVIVVHKPAYRTERRIHPATVTKVGWKYLTVHIDGRADSDLISFDITNNYRQNTPCCADYHLYPSIEAYLRALERNYYLFAAEQKFRQLPSATISKKLSFDDLKYIALKLGADPWSPPEDITPQQ